MVLWFAVCAALLTCLATANPIVPTSDGPVEGFIKSNVQGFLGIPFAAPPIGKYRFMSPQPVTPWKEPYQAFKHGNICLQIHAAGDILLGDEDCLYMNVHVPAGVSLPADPTNMDSKLPVMLWIYGGGYIFGDGYEFGFYDPTNLVTKHNVIIVSMNYRLSSLGFLAHEALRNEDPHHSTGNMALQDQQAVLMWVSKNIANFGGDPNRITIWGESAGAFSVCWHLANPVSRGLFHAAIMESGTCDNPSFFQPLNKALEFGAIFADSAGCNATTQGDAEFLACLRRLSKEDLIKPLTTWSNANWPYTNHPPPPGSIPPTGPFMPWGPTVDGTIYGLPALPLDMMRRGDFAKVPLIIGTNQNEGDIFIPAVPDIVHGVSFPLKDSDLMPVLEHFFNASASAAVLQQYPSYDFKSADERCSRILRDFFFVCATRRIARNFAKHNVSAYVYHFTYKGDFIEDPILGDYHSSELEYVWDNQWPPLIHIFSDRDKAMAKTFGSYWTSLAKTGSPNNPDSPVTWPSWNTTTEQNLVMDTPASVEDDYVEGRCNFWDTVSFTF